MIHADRKSFDTGKADQAGDSIEGITNRLETLINERDRQAQAALADFKMSHADEEYHRVERRWKDASNEVHEIIRILRGTIGKNTQTATTTVTKTRGAITNIG